MAMLATQYKSQVTNADELSTESIIPHLSKEEMKQPMECEAPINQYTGPKKLDMPMIAT